MSPLADPAYVAQQYADANRFDARAELYRRFSKAPESWHAFVLRGLALDPGMRVLEVGCGPGNLWGENAARLPKDLTLTLVDASPGMLAQARERLAAAGVSARFAHMDVQRLDLPSESFDVAVANHVLYHVPDRARALAELRRVLRPRGRVMVATNGADHLAEVGRLIERFDVPSSFSDAGGFTLEDARREVSAVFGDVRMHERRDVLRVTDAAVLVAWIRSTVPPGRDAARELAAIERQVSQQGELPITVSAGFALGTRAA
jgi:SAM-dependent methyltransferase